MRSTSSLKAVLSVTLEARLQVYDGRQLYLNDPGTPPDTDDEEGEAAAPRQRLTAQALDAIQEDPTHDPDPEQLGSGD